MRILEWPSLSIILDEPKAHKSVHDMDFSLDSEFLASTSTDGSARIWKMEDGVPVTTLTRDSDEKIELCCFSKDGKKTLSILHSSKRYVHLSEVNDLYYHIIVSQTIKCISGNQTGAKALTSVWDISTWKKIGHKRLLKKSAAVKQGWKISCSVSTKFAFDLVIYTRLYTHSSAVAST
ncbi:putative transcription factor WD40-like family [Rosa chinensis]|uniref:Putative transcription factor WD40-like family n=1 Tax=Rosa chinensis TaxID=74649 RepID=A0A2P6SCQ6_ROSCH|nr:putative transcription factor WD40-like family [Rosa chinensis]